MKYFEYIMICQEKFGLSQKSSLNIAIEGYISCPQNIKAYVQVDKKESTEGNKEAVFPKNHCYE